MRPRRAANAESKAPAARADTCGRRLRRPHVAVRRVSRPAPRDTRCGEGADGARAADARAAGSERRVRLAGNEKQGPGLLCLQRALRTSCSWRDASCSGTAALPAGLRVYIRARRPRRAPTLCDSAPHHLRQLARPRGLPRRPRPPCSLRAATSALVVSLARRQRSTGPVGCAAPGRAVKRACDKTPKMTRLPTSSHPAWPRARLRSPAGGLRRPYGERNGRGDWLSGIRPPSGVTQPSLLP